MELAYAAHSARCALLLDADGICRWYVMKVDDETVAASAERCIGAQFVATLDPEAKGLLGHEPAVGKNVLFARVVDGRVTLVRFGPLVQFDKLGPAADAAETTAPEAHADAHAETTAPEANADAAPEPPPEEAPAANAEEAPEPTTAEHPHVALAPPPPLSEPATLRAVYTVPVDVDDRETKNDLFDEDALATAAGEGRAYRPSGFVIRAAPPADDDAIATAAFTRAVVVRASGRGMLPRRG